MLEWPRSSCLNAFAQFIANIPERAEIALVEPLADRGKHIPKLAPGVNRKCSAPADAFNIAIAFKRCEAPEVDDAVPFGT